MFNNNNSMLGYAKAAQGAQATGLPVDPYTGQSGP